MNREWLSQHVAGILHRTLSRRVNFLQALLKGELYEGAVDAQMLGFFVIDPGVEDQEESDAVSKAIVQGITELVEGPNWVVIRRVRDIRNPLKLCVLVFAPMEVHDAIATVIQSQPQDTRFGQAFLTEAAVAVYELHRLYGQELSIQKGVTLLFERALHGLVDGLRYLAMERYLRVIYMRRILNLAIALGKMKLVVSWDMPLVVKAQQRYKPPLSLSEFFQNPNDVREIAPAGEAPKGHLLARLYHQLLVQLWLLGCTVVIRERARTLGVIYALSFVGQLAMSFLLKKKSRSCLNRQRDPISWTIDSSLRVQWN